MNRTRTLLRPAALLATLALAACTSASGGGGGPTDPPAAGTTVHLTAATFNPSDVTVARGAAVTWQSDTSIPHTITLDPGQAVTGWASHDISGTGATFQFTFINAGNYAYHCNIHAGMTGVVHVN
jgi:plastocyanin